MKIICLHNDALTDEEPDVKNEVPEEANPEILR